MTFDIAYTTFTKGSTIKVYPIKIVIDGNEVPVDKLNSLFINDGFEGLEYFMTYWNPKNVKKEFKGIIIHWTDFKY